MRIFLRTAHAHGHYGLGEPKYRCDGAAQKSARRNIRSANASVRDERHILGSPLPRLLADFGGNVLKATRINDDPPLSPAALLFEEPTTRGIQQRTPLLDCGRSAELPQSDVICDDSSFVEKIARHRARFDEQGSTFETDAPEMATSPEAEFLALLIKLSPPFIQRNRRRLYSYENSPGRMSSLKRTSPSEKFRPAPSPRVTLLSTRPSPNAPPSHPPATDPHTHRRPTLTPTRRPVLTHYHPLIFRAPKHKLIGRPIGIFSQDW